MSYIIKIKKREKKKLLSGRSGDDNQNYNGDVDQVIEEDLTPDDILIELGGCGVFQVLLAVIVQSMKIVVCWGMGGNAFFAYVPKWRCVDDYDNSSGYNNVSTTTTTIPTDNSTPSENYWNQKCFTAAGERCTTFEFDDSIHTLVSEVRHSWFSICNCSILVITKIIVNLISSRYENPSKKIFFAFL